MSLELNKIYQGDTIEILKTWPDEFIDCVITSPPYFGLRSYLPKDHPDKKKEIGSENSMEEHIKVLMDIFAEIKRVMKPTGSFWLNLGDCYGGISTSVSYAEKSCGKNSILKGKLDKLPAAGHCRGLMDKCLMMMPERIALKMLEDEGDDIYELRKDLTQSERIAIMEEIKQYEDNKLR